MQAAVGAAAELMPQSMRRRSRPALPEMTEPEVQRHYLHLSQETLGMMNISLFGTCTMKYNARVSEAVAARPFVADVHPLQAPATMQGILEIIHEFDLMLRALSGMDQFIFQAAAAPMRPTRMLRHARLSHSARRARPAQRDHHHHPGASLQCGDRRGGRLQGHHAQSRGAMAIPRSKR